MRIGGGLPLSIMAGVSANGLTRLSEKWNRQENDVCGDHGARTGCLRGEQDRRSAGPHGDARIPASTSCKGGWRTSPCRPFPTKPKPRLYHLYLALGEKDEALAWLEKAYKAKSSTLLYMRCWPEFERLRADPRFADLVRRVGNPS